MTKKHATKTVDVPARLSRIRQTLYQLRKEQAALVWELAKPSPMIKGSFYEVYKTCTGKNCRCQKGERHGPFPALSLSVQGKHKLVMVRQADRQAVEQKAKAYRRFQRGLSRLRKINREIEALFIEIRGYFLEDYS